MRTCRDYEVPEINGAMQYTDANLTNASVFCMVYLVPTCLFVECLCKLVDTGRDLQSLIKHLFLTLKTNIFGPTNIAS